MNCDVCGQSAVGVASSACGGVSFAYCSECLRAGREPWSAMVACCSTLDGEVAEWFRPIFEATCKFYGKLEKELWEDAAEAWKEYEKAMEAKCEPE